jgi:hypothetical protein
MWKNFIQLSYSMPIYHQHKNLLETWKKWNATEKYIICSLNWHVRLNKLYMHWNIEETENKSRENPAET